MSNALLLEDTDDVICRSGGSCVYRGDVGVRMSYCSVGIQVFIAAADSIKYFFPFCYVNVAFVDAFASTVAIFAEILELCRTIWIIFGTNIL